MDWGTELCSGTLVFETDEEGQRTGYWICTECGKLSNKEEVKHYPLPSPEQFFKASLVSYKRRHQKRHDPAYVNKMALYTAACALLQASAYPLEDGPELVERMTKPHLSAARPATLA